MRSRRHSRDRLDANSPDGENAGVPTLDYQNRPSSLDSCSARRGLALKVLLGAALLSTTLACESKPTTTTLGGNGALGDALAAIGKRGTAINDFQLSGTLTPTGSEKGVHFELAQRAPKLLRLDVVEESAHMAFDGQTLTIVQDEQKTAVRQKFSGKDAAAEIVTLRNVFGSFACEGWRPPTLSPKSATATLSQDSKVGAVWTLIQPLQDTTLKEVRYRLRAPKGDFLSMETLNKSGDVVAYTRVIEEYEDIGTRMRFPKRWTVKDAARAHEVELDKIAINAGISKDYFIAPLPDGFQVHDVGAPAQSQ